MRYYKICVLPIVASLGETGRGSSTEAKQCPASDSVVNIPKKTTYQYKNVIFRLL